MIFSLENYKGKYVMHLKTREEAREFSEFLDAAGKCWKDGALYTDLNFWYKYGKNTAYSFNEGGYADIDYYIKKYIKKGYTILEWSDFEQHIFRKSDLQDGDVIIYHNGDVGIVNLNKTMITLQNNWDKIESFDENLFCILSNASSCDIVKVYRPIERWQCQFNPYSYTQGRLMFERKG